MKDVLGLTTTTNPTLFGAPSPVSAGSWLDAAYRSGDCLIEINLFRMYRRSAELDAVADAALLRARQIFERNGFGFGRIEEHIPTESMIKSYRDLDTVDADWLVLYDGRRKGAADVFLVERLTGYVAFEGFREKGGRGNLEGSVVALYTDVAPEAVGRVLAHELGHTLGLAHRVKGSDGVAGFVPFERSLMAQSVDVANPQLAIELGATERTTVRISPFSHPGV